MCLNGIGASVFLYGKYNMKTERQASIVALAQST